MNDYCVLVVIWLAAAGMGIWLGLWSFRGIFNFLLTSVCMIAPFIVILVFSTYPAAIWVPVIILTGFAWWILIHVYKLAMARFFGWLAWRARERKDWAAVSKWLARGSEYGLMMRPK